MAKANSFVGIDLSPDSIKVVELRPERGKPQLVTYGYTESKSDVLKGDFIVNKNITSTLIKEVADQAKVTTNYALERIDESVFDCQTQVTIEKFCPDEVRDELTKLGYEVTRYTDLMSCKFKVSINWINADKNF